MSHWELPRDIEVFEIGKRRLYVKNGSRSIAISEDDLTPEELMAIAQDIAARRTSTNGCLVDCSEAAVASVH
jgi:hypothetical protein